MHAHQPAAAQATPNRRPLNPGREQLLPGDPPALHLGYRTNDSVYWSAWREPYLPITHDLRHAVQRRRVFRALPAPRSRFNR
jgi:hypothetical protein